MRTRPLRRFLLLVAAVALIPACRRAPAAAALTVSGQLVITRGGTYSGSWSSDDPAMAAVVINTAEPVLIDGATIRSRGALIAIAASHSKVTVRKTRGVGLNPNVAGKTAGRFLSAEGFDHVVLDLQQPDRLARRASRWPADRGTERGEGWGKVTAYGRIG